MNEKIKSLMEKASARWWQDDRFYFVEHERYIRFFPNNGSSNLIDLAVGVFNPFYYPPVHFIGDVEYFDMPKERNRR